MFIRCNPYQEIGGRQKRPFDTDERTLIDAFTKRYQKFERAAAQTPEALERQTKEQAVRDSIVRDWINKTADVVRVFPEQKNRLMDFLVTDLGLKAKKLGLDPSNEFTLAGEVRYNLEDYQQVAEGMVNLAGRINSLNSIAEFVDMFKTLSREKGMTLEQARRAQLDALEVGRIPETLSTKVLHRIEVDGDYHSPVSRFLFDRYTRFVKTLQDYNFTPEEIADVINGAEKVSRNFKEVQAVASAIGVDVPSLENIGYFTRIVTDDFKLRLKDLDFPELLNEIRVGTNELSTVFSRSRKTVHYIPYDSAIASELLGVSTQELAVLLDNPNAFRKFLHENVTASQLDTLVDSGIFEKLPMSSTEVFDYFLKQYELPYRSISDMFVVDPFRAIQKYTSSLQEAAGNSAMIRGLVDGRARSAGWAVSKEIVDADPGKYADFVPLGPYLDRWGQQAKISTAQVMQRLGIAGDEQQVSQLLKTFNDSYVHPVVANQWSALMSLSSNPAMMSTAAGIIQHSLKLLNRLTITGSNTTYVLNNALGSILQTVSGGGNMLRLLPNIMDIVKAMKYGMEVFDNTRYYIKDGDRMLTRRQFVEEFLIKRGQALTPGITKTPYDLNVGSLTDFARLLMDTPVAFANALQDIATYTLAKGNIINGKTIPPWERVGRFTRATAQKAYSGLDNIFAPLALISNIFETAAKLTVLDTVMSKATPLGETASVLGQLGTSFQYTKFNTLDEGFRHLDSYFVNAYSTGRFTKWVGSFIIPFAAWRMANPPMQIRHMFRHPQQYLAYHRLHALNQQSIAQDEAATNASIEPWLLDAYPWHIGADANGQPMFVIPTSFDPIADGFLFTKGALEGGASFLGYKKTDPSTLREQARNETTQKFLLGLASQLYAPTRGLIEFVSGVDTFTGKRIDENPTLVQPDFLGINMNPRLVLMLQKLPILSRIDAVNPLGLFGRAPQVSTSTGEVLVPGTPSWAGGQRTRRDTRMLTYETAPMFAKIMMLAGMNIRSVDYDRNLQNTYGDITATIGYLENSINDTRIQLTKDVDTGVVSRSEFNRRRRALDDQVSVWGQLLVDKMRLASYMQQHNTLPKDVLRELDRKRIGVRQLPLPGDEQLNDIANKVITTSRELDALEKRVR